MSYPPTSPKIALLSNYVPIQCGISTFAKNLYDSLAKGRRGQVVTIAIDDECDTYEFPAEVAFRIAKNSKLDYVEAAEFINSSSVEVVCVQHEYGIYGGIAGDFLLEALDRITKPIVVTLHTVLDSPSENQSRVLKRIAARAAKVIVMSTKAVQMLTDVYGIEKSKISMIHHGVPDAFENTLGVYRLPRHAGATMLTFGLLSPDKGIENVIQAMPEIVKSRPDAKYLVVGATHPHIRAHSGEIYRESLVQLAEDLGVSKNVEFVNRFMTPSELIEIIQKADVYITPYLKPQQITSGTLAYAVGSGKAVISTPYWYAEELLADDRGMLVPWRDPEAIAQAAIRILTDEKWRRRITANALRFGKNMSWQAVGKQYLELMDSVAENHELLLPIPRALIAKTKPKLPEFDLSHLRRMTDDTGLLQHAIYMLPRYSEGYCLDDNCRALMLTAQIADSDEPPPADLSRLTDRYLAFVASAFSPETGKFRNFMSYSREWLEVEGSEDSQGRAIWCLAGFTARTTNKSHSLLANELLKSSVGSSAHWTSPRAWAYTLIGLGELYSTRFYTPDLSNLTNELSTKLSDLLMAQSDDRWPWFEPYLSYCNARLPQALLVAGEMLGKRAMKEKGISLLDWLWNQQITKGGLFEPIGCSEVFHKEGTKPRFDQQPVETYAMISACLSAWRLSGDARWKERAIIAFGWFLGENHLGLPLLDSESGGCFDGLHEKNLNQNQGAESTVSFLMAREEIREILQPRRSLPLIIEVA